MTKKKLLIVSIVIGVLLVFNTIAGILFLVDKYSPKPLGWEYGIEITNVEWSIENWQDGDFDGDSTPYYFCDFQFNGKIKNNNRDDAHIEFTVLFSINNQKVLVGGTTIYFDVKSNKTIPANYLSTGIMISSRTPIIKDDINGIWIMNFIVLRNDNLIER